jgi:heat-inducible transcriptional repressor
MHIKDTLDDRSRSVLKELVQVYVATGEPVASGTLARRLRHAVSSATVRTVMAHLEHLGLLEQPHTSAGRIPTDDALRLYVDAFMRQEALSAHDAAAIESGLTTHCAASASEVMECASRLLSQLSGNVGFAVAPDAGKTRVQHIEFVRLPFPRILVVLVSRGGMVTHRVVELPEEVSQEQLQRYANCVNARFVGVDLATIRSALLSEMHRDRALLDSLLERLLAATDRAFAPATEGSVYLGGTSRLLDHTDHANLARMRAIYRTLEERSRMLRVLNACMGGRGVRVLVNCEGFDPELKGVTLVTAGYDFDGNGGWGLGVMGPTPMRYPRIVSIVTQIAQRTQGLLAELSA